MKEYTIDRAVPGDMVDIGALFTESFRDSVLFHCGCLPNPQAAQDIFTLVYETEPEASFVARQADGKVLGYCFAPTAVSRLWVRALTHGHILKWCWRWLIGKYGIGLYPVKMLLLNKLAFFRSALAPGKQAKARILSIAVASDCRGLGLGGALMDQAVNYFKDCKVIRVRLEVRPDNFSAIKLYEHRGFVTVGSTYDPQGEWLIMLKEMEH